MKSRHPPFRIAAVKSRSRAVDRTNSSPGRLSRQAWIDGAVAKLAEDSVAALRVDELAEALGVTKGSFYWHFENREALLDAVLDWWRQLMTNETAASLNRLPDVPRDRLIKLISIALSPRPNVPGGPFELTLRDWARRDPAVMKVVVEVDRAREAIVTDLYLAMGLEKSVARDYAHAHMAYVIGDRMTSPSTDLIELKRRRRIALAVLLPPLIDK
jgi:AcrR family transcriptional regulator